MFEPQWTTEAAVAEQPVIAKIDATAAKHKDPDNRECDTGPAEEPRQQGQQCEQMIGAHGGGVAPIDLALTGADRKRQGECSTRHDSRVGLANFLHQLALLRNFNMSCTRLRPEHITECCGTNSSRHLEGRLRRIVPRCPEPASQLRMPRGPGRAAFCLNVSDFRSRAGNQLAARRLIRLSASVVSFLSVAFSSSSVFCRTLAQSLRPSCFAHEIRLP